MSRKIKRISCFLVLVALFVAGCSETKQPTASDLIRKGDYNKAAELLVLEKNDDQNLEDLYNYATARKYYQQKDYKVTSSHINKIDSNYDGEFKQEILDFKKIFLPEQINVGLDYLTKDNYEDASQIFVGNKELEPLFNLSMAVEQYYKGDYKMATIFVDQMGDYSGYGAEKAKSLKQGVLDKSIPKIKSPKGTSHQQTITKKPYGVELGMTKEEVLKSSWGRPEHINTTTTVYGVSEQWVYSNYNYLYFENGYLTSIQN